MFGNVNPIVTFEVMEDKTVFKDKGRPRVYNFDKLSIGEVQHIACKKSVRDDKLKSARSMCSTNSIEGKKFRATATETGIAIKRDA
jgi:hypothetical protein